MPHPTGGDDRFAALAHELRTALTVASMGVQLALRRTAATADGPDRERTVDDLAAALAAIQEVVLRTDALLDGVRQVGGEPD